MTLRPGLFVIVTCLLTDYSKVPFLEEAARPSVKHVDRQTDGRIDTPACMNTHTHTPQHHNAQPG